MTLRLVLAVSLDGRLAPPAGGAAQLGGAGDRRVLEEALAWADVAVVGAGTVRAHGCSCLIHRPELLQQRQSRGQSPQPPLLIASRQPEPVGFDHSWRLWGQPLQLWWLSSAPLLPAPPEGFARQLALESWQGLLDQLNSEGHQRVLLLGGAQLAGALLDEDLVDELQLTLCPLLLGGEHSWLPAAARPHPHHWHLQEQRPLGEGEVLLRYQRTGNS